MINKKEFEQMRKELNEFEIKREDTIITSRDIIKLSKQIIYSLHRGETEVNNLVKEIKTKIKLLDKTKDYDTGISSVAFQEYVEAVAYFEFVKSDKIPSAKELDVNIEAYLGGMADLTGELVRKAVHEAIKKNFNSVLKIKELVEEVYGEFLKFDLRNGELRKKSDSIKWNLNKLEDLAFSLQSTRK
ncbi:MAG TPA: hypothetical protein VJH92_05105 [Candidatus Nanoarchaeia archaeon]|nr:hypothetical protein [Candidatus Nanoarchaeia archaeon]